MLDLKRDLLMKYGDKMEEGKLRQINAAADRLIWDLDLDKAGRIKQDGSVLNWLIDQVNRYKNGQPSVISPGNGEDIFKILEMLLMK